MQPKTAPNETRLPRAVLRRSEAINARYAPPPPEPETPSAASPAPAPVPAPPAATTTDPPPAPPAPPDRTQDPTYWQQRFKVTEGILGSVRAQHTETLQAKDQQIAELKGQITEIQAKAPAQLDLLQFFTQEEIDEYGEKQCRVMANAAVAAAKQTAKPLIAAEVQPQKDAQVARDTETERQRLLDFQLDLTKLRPTWQADDKDPRWHLWLSEDDELTGEPRQRTLDRHSAARNAPMIGRMFEAWAKTIAAPPAPAPPPVPPIVPHGSGAAPGSDAPAAPDPALAGLTAPSAQEVKDFYKRSALGKVKDDERAKFDARLKLRHPERV